MELETPVFLKPRQPFAAIYLHTPVSPGAISETFRHGDAGDLIPPISIMQ